MYILLAKKEIQHLKHEYQLRAAILLLFFLSGAVWLGIISLFPSYVISITQERNASDQAGKIDSTRQANGSSQIAAEVRNANALVTTIQSSQDSIFFSSLIEDIDYDRPAGITLNFFTLGHVAHSATQSTIGISGMATTRDALVAFKKNLQNDARLSKVLLPVSSLAQDTNINFSMSMTALQ